MSSGLEPLHKPQQISLQWYMFDLQQSAYHRTLLSLCALELLEPTMSLIGLREHCSNLLWLIDNYCSYDWLTDQHTNNTLTIELSFLLPVIPFTATYSHMDILVASHHTHPSWLCSILQTLQRSSASFRHFSIHIATSSKYLWHVVFES